jgi:hypothetical protein
MSVKYQAICPQIVTEYSVSANLKNLTANYLGICPPNIKEFVRKLSRNILYLLIQRNMTANYLGICPSNIKDCACKLSRNMSANFHEICPPIIKEYAANYHGICQPIIKNVLLFFKNMMRFFTLLSPIFPRRCPKLWHIVHEYTLIFYKIFFNLTLL